MINSIPIADSIAGKPATLVIDSSAVTLSEGGRLASAMALLGKIRALKASHIHIAPSSGTAYLANSSGIAVAAMVEAVAADRQWQEAVVVWPLDTSVLVARVEAGTVVEESARSIAEAREALRAAADRNQPGVVLPGGIQSEAFEPDATAVPNLRRFRCRPVGIEFARHGLPAVVHLQYALLLLAPLLLGVLLMPSTDGKAPLVLLARAPTSVPSGAGRHLVQLVRALDTAAPWFSATGATTVMAGGDKIVIGGDRYALAELHRLTDAIGGKLALNSDSGWRIELPVQSAHRAPPIPLPASLAALAQAQPILPTAAKHLSPDLGSALENLELTYLFTSPSRAEIGALAAGLDGLPATLNRAEVRIRAGRIHSFDIRLHLRGRTTVPGATP